MLLGLLVEKGLYSTNLAPRQLHPGQYGHKGAEVHLSPQLLLVEGQVARCSVSGFGPATVQPGGWHRAAAHCLRPQRSHPRYAAES